jgi:hypothetical protein
MVWAELDTFLTPVAGRAAFLGAVMVDITERQRAEVALKAQTELAHAARLTTLGELTASIALEINQPLAGIAPNGAAGLKWLNRKKPDLDQARDSLSRIVRDSARKRRDPSSAGVRQEVRSQLARLDIDDATREVLALTGGELGRNEVVAAAIARSRLQTGLRHLSNWRRRPYGRAVSAPKRKRASVQAPAEGASMAFRSKLVMVSPANGFSR